jgi:hypothetical protein
MLAESTVIANDSTALLESMNTTIQNYKASRATIQQEQEDSDGEGLESEELEGEGHEMKG